MDAGVVLGSIGAATGLGSLAFTVYAWRAERADRRSAVTLEREARQDEIAIERERLDAEFADRARLRRADINARQERYKRYRDGRRDYRFVLRNMGPSYSKHVTAWLVDDKNQPLTDRPPGAPLDPGEERLIQLAVPNEAWENSVPVRLVVEWFNDHGQREQEPSNLRVEWD